jgi:methylglutaconyl-CoA hydratase
LFAELYPSIDTLDDAVDNFANVLAHSSIEAMQELKKVLWHGTEDWDHLLKERAAISGRLILTKYAKDAIQKFKERAKSARA